MKTKWANRYSDPVENLRSYIHVHQGLDRHDRQLDVEAIAQKLECGQQLANILAYGWLLIGPETSDQEREEWRQKTILALQDYDAV